MFRRRGTLDCILSTKIQLKKITENQCYSLNRKILSSAFLISLIYPGKAIAASDADCYKASNVGTVGEAGTICANKLIVDRDLLIEGINNGLVGNG